MEHVISDYITFSQKYNPFELALIRPEHYMELPPEKLAAKLFGFNPIRIRIKEDWYDVLSLSEVVRSPSKIDGKYHFLYIQINCLYRQLGMLSCGQFQASSDSLLCSSVI